MVLFEEELLLLFSSPFTYNDSWEGGRGCGLSMESTWGFTWEVREEDWKCTVPSYPAIPCAPQISVSRIFPCVLALRKGQITWLTK